MGSAVALTVGEAELRSRAIDASIDSLLLEGGDDRVSVDAATGLNMYGCAARPRADVLAFSSSTASTISAPAFERVVHARDALARQHGRFEAAFDSEIGRMRRSLLSCLGLSGSGAEVVFSPSGTDSQLHALFLAEMTLGRPLATVVCASDQTGSGTVHTSCRRHFSARTAHGRAVEKGAPISATAEAVEAIGISLFHDDGTPRSASEIDAAVTEAVVRAVAAGRKVLVQTMESSKLGWRAPSDGCAVALQSRWPGAVQIIADACQMRTGRARIRTCLDRGWIVLITGSKFFMGPGFSGATLVPAALSERLGRAVIAPAGMADYATRFDLPPGWRGLRAALPAEPNLGQWLRWEAALEEIRAYYTLPAVFAAPLFMRLEDALSRIMASSRSLEPMPAEGGCPRERHDDEFPARTVFPFFVRRGQDHLCHEELVRLYRILNQDASASLPAEATPDERRVAAVLCHIGQPVRLAGGRSVLRIALGSRTATGVWSPDAAAVERNMGRIVDQLATVVRKIDLLANLP